MCLSRRIILLLLIIIIRKLRVIIRILVLTLSVPSATSCSNNNDNENALPGDTKTMTDDDIKNLYDESVRILKERVSYCFAKNDKCLTWLQPETTCPDRLSTELGLLDLNSVSEKVYFRPCHQFRHLNVTSSLLSRAEALCSQPKK